MSLPDTVLQDVRYAVRMLFRNRAATTVTVFSLALGIGVNTTAFTAYKAMVARALDGREPETLVSIALTRDSGASDFIFSYPDYESYRDTVRSFSGLIAFRPARARLSNAGEMISQRRGAATSGIGRLGLLPASASNAEFASVFVVSENYFNVLGISTIRGRVFDSSNPEVLISENYWMARFSGDAAIVGRSIHLNGHAVTIVGVTPRDFVGTGVTVPAFWIPAHLEPLMQSNVQWLRDRENRRYRIFGRLASGTTAGQAQLEMNAAINNTRMLHHSQSDAAKPATALVWRGSPFPLPLKQYGGLVLSILLIMGATAMVLLVACANAGSLQLARARARQNELRTRLSLGASRLRIIRQLITESALLGLMAGIGALLFTWAFLTMAVTLASQAMPVEYGTLIFDVTPDLEILAYAFAVSLLAGMLSGLAPAVESSRRALASATRSSTSPRGSRRLQDVLLAAQVALSCVLLIAGSVSLRSSLNALNSDTGYDSKHVLHVDLQFPEDAKYTAERRLGLARELRTRVAALPGVSAITSARPPGLSRFRTSAGDHAILPYSYVQPNYFQTLGIPLIAGSLPRQQEQSLILSESAARYLWPGENPIGRTLRLGLVDERFRPLNELHTAGFTYQVAGIVGDKRSLELNGSDSKEIYLSLPDDRLQNYPLLIRAESTPASLARALENVIASVDPAIVATSNSLEEMLRQSPLFIVSSLAAAVALTVGLAGLLLALLGIYGTVSYIVVLRTPEVGIRKAIGAQNYNVLCLILVDSARPVLAGLVAGMGLALFASYMLRSLLYGLTTVDAFSLAGVSGIFVATALLASLPPARRALHIDPMIALRYE